MPLIEARNLEFSIGGPYPLLEDVDFELRRNERVCIVGRNGAGKSTLLRLLAGEIEPDEGRVRVGEATVVTRLAQEVPAGTAGSVFDVVASSLGETGALLAEYHRLAQDLAAPGSAERMGRVQARIEAAGGWDIDRRVSEVLDRLQLPEATEFAELSGGLKRRVLLAQALAPGPDVLLLDEPTNHLDIEAIDWLEGFLKGFPGSLVFITHDRRFLRNLATRIVEIDRARLTSWPGDYDNYLRRRAERLHAEELERQRFDRKLAQEEVWIRQGIKARRTRNEGRVRALQQMRRERAQRRERQGNVRMDAAEAGRSGRRVVEAEHVRFGWDGRPLVQDFSITILRGDRVGLVGPNGVGKTTLLQLLIGRLPPQSGRITLGTGLEIAWFDQQRAQLDENANAVENVAGGQDFIELGGRRRHVMSYLQDFLFTPDRARAPITRLSGGERNRLLLARLFARPSNLLVMDEPTNDLDVETLEMLEELLAEYRGTLLLVSHDREFLDNVVTSILVLDGNGGVEESVGGYSDWLARQQPAERGTARRHDRPRGGAGKAGTQRQRRTLNNWEQRELSELPERIERLEARIAELTERLADPELYREAGDEVARVNERLTETQSALDAAYERWHELDEFASGQGP
ncbi:MAG: ATP-binding cassette domain-containing protein [Halofilum sp. (in: g-proteobacteria)]|nr:ATP-binding cassette domain-containing protein [Halofilum sp. (in: g-proteobacteria)]